ncbi:MAG: hypothetical protein ACI905_002521, partial [Roseivirga sp.]
TSNLKLNNRGFLFAYLRKSFTHRRVDFGRNMMPKFIIDKSQNDENAQDKSWFKTINCR